MSSQIDCSGASNNESDCIIIVKVKIQVDMWMLLIKFADEQFFISESFRIFKRNEVKVSISGIWTENSSSDDQLLWL